MKYDEFRSRLIGLFEEFEEENGCIIENIRYTKTINENLGRKGKKEIINRNFTVELM